MECDGIRAENNDSDIRESRLTTGNCAELKVLEQVTVVCSNFVFFFLLIPEVSEQSKAEGVKMGYQGEEEVELKLVLASCLGS